MSQHKILIADDDPRMVKALSVRLKSMGYEIVTAPDAYQALASVRRESPDLLVLDIHMPAGDGFSVQERMNNNPAMPNLPVIYITGDESDVACVQASYLGACAVLYKPVNIERLVQAICRALTPRAA